MKSICTGLFAAALGCVFIHSVSAADAVKAREKVLYAFCSQQYCTDGDFPQASLIDVKGTLYGTTVYGGRNDDCRGYACGTVFALDPNTCKLLWRSHEDFAGGELKVNRGVAWLDHRVFRGTTDGKVVAYDGRNGKRL